jgi:hypothetical protein
MPQVDAEEHPEDGLQLHIEAKRFIEAGDLAKALRAMERQYETFLLREGVVSRTSQATLRVSSFKPGSLDILFTPEVISTVTAFAPALAGLETVAKFSDHLKKIFELFKRSTNSPPKDLSSISAKDCDDIMQIAAPIAKNGGSQTFNQINGGITINLYAMNQSEASDIMSGAANTKAAIKEPESKRRTQVPLVWSQIDRNQAKTAGIRSPDQGIIQEIDSKPHSILFSEDISYLKDEIIRGENPLTKIYFVDVDIIEVEDSIVAYRVTAIHSMQDISRSA